MPSSCRDPRADFRAAAGAPSDVERAAREAHALLEAHEAEAAAAAGLGEIDAAPVVGDDELERAVAGAERDREGPGRRVARGVPERLLGDAVDAERDVVGGRLEAGRRLEPDLELVLAPDLGAQRAERGDDPRVAEQRRVEL